MRKLLLSVGLCFFGAFSHAQNGLESIIVEKYYIANAADNAADPTLPVGAVTYRVYVDMLPGYKFKMAYGSSTHPLSITSTTSFYNEGNYGGVNPSLSLANAKKKTAMLDSYLSAGGACAGYVGIMKTEDDGVGNFVISNACLVNNNPKMGIALTTQDGMKLATVPAYASIGFTNETDVFNDGTANGNSFLINNAAWSCLAGATGLSASNKVLIGQFTTDGVFSISLNIQLQTPTNTAEKYVISNPVNGEIVIPSLVQSFDPNEVPSSIMQFVYTSDAHYGITRSRFQKNSNVNATVVNGAMIAKMNKLTSLSFPNDGGVNEGKDVDSIDFVVMTGDIANRSESSKGIQSAAASWAQFQTDYINGITLKDKSGSKAKLYLAPGNHDVSNAIGYYKTLAPAKDSSAMANMYNLMIGTRPSGNYDYANEKVHYSKNIGGIHFMFVCMWPDSAERVWMANDLASVSPTTPVFIFTHDQPAVETKHLTNPNGSHTINNTDKFENLVLETLKDGTTISSPSTLEQRGFSSFVKTHPNIVVYFHGNDNKNEYYKYNGPDNDIVLDVVRVDSPMKGSESGADAANGVGDETKLSFQLITVDTLAKVLTVRECLWNTDTVNVNTPIVFGTSKTISYDVNKYAQVHSPGYTKGDFHQHSTFTDGSYSLGYMMNKDTQFGLDWWANSEHGGGFNTNGLRTGTDLGANFYWDSYNPNPIVGTVASSGGHQVMWRWQSLRDSSFSEIKRSRELYPNNLVIQSYEMNVPGHEHGSMGLIANQFDMNANVNPLAQYEFMFDNNDADLIGGVAQGWTKSTNSGHTKTLEAITWLQTNYPTQSYLVPAHPERKAVASGYSISSFRDMNNAGPSVCFGFESMPGHQKDAGRGGYTKTAQGGGTYGGAGYFSARVGGLWDALLTEGRAWWLFANSDCHDEAGDFYPGQYQKNYTYCTDRTNPQAVVDGLRSGNTWVVEGDLIDSLIFDVHPTNTPTATANMGQTLTLAENSLTIHIKARDPQGNNYNTFGGSNNPTLNHIDLIAGQVSGKLAPSDSKYNVDSVQTTHVIARFDAAGNIVDSKGITSTAWTTTSNGWKEMTFTVANVTDSMYFRLRGSNLGLNVTNETDAAGNPLSDTLVGTNDAVKAFSDLWFYSNPIFVAYNGGTVSTKQNINNETGIIKIYPNPAKEQLNIEVSENSTIQMFDLNGRQVIAETAVNANQKQTISVSNINDGVYFVKIYNDKFVKMQKVVITK
ncbi:MAG: T9SS type A sorting domain-containing protein [Bacteroidota bacterium]